jgi:hypothetical protein
MRAAGSVRSVSRVSGSRQALSSAGLEGVEGGPGRARRASMRRPSVGQLTAVRGRRWLGRMRWHLKALLGMVPSWRALIARPPSLKAVLAHAPLLRSPWVLGGCLLLSVLVMVNCQSGPQTQTDAPLSASLSVSMGAPVVGASAGTEQTAQPGAARQEAVEIPAAPSAAQLHTQSGQDVAFVVRDHRLEAVSGSGHVLWRWETDLAAQGCALDAATDTLWWTTPDAQGERVDLHVLDLRSPSRAVVIARGLPAQADWAITRGDAAPAWPQSAQVGVAVRLAQEPALEVSLSCEGDMAWFCYEGEPAQGKLNFDVEAALHNAERVQLNQGALLARFAARAQDISTQPVAQAPARLEHPAISAAACAAWPDDCGAVQPLPNSPLWAVTVGNDRGDFTHTFQALYDPASQQFIDLQTGQRQPNPPEGEELSLVISPSGQRYLTEDALGGFEGDQALHTFDVACGWLGGGARFGAR